MEPWLKPYKSIILATATLLLSISLTDSSWAGVGKVTEQTGPTEILRSNKSISSSLNATVEMNDTIVTARARAQLTFEDQTTVKITEQSKLIIDDFVYDPKAGTGKLAMKVALGTARYASGQIAKNSPQQVAVKTPTATVGVRGTDFSMTVDELGRSLVMLLPSCDSKSCVTGQIEVSNEVGSVLLTQAYQATLVTSLTSMPTSPVIVSVDQLNINNMLIVSPPREIKEQQSTSQAATALDINFLNQDFLKYDELDKNLLEGFNRLNENFLDGELLENALDSMTAAINSSQAAILEFNSMLPAYDAVSGLKYQVDDEGNLKLYKSSTHFFQVTVPKEQSAVLQAWQDGIPVYQKINTGGSTAITIVQR